MGTSREDKVVKTYGIFHEPLVSSTEDEFAFVFAVPALEPDEPLEPEPLEPEVSAPEPRPHENDPLF
jgi:hypothetical protein